jgi:16S rRNA (guanine527-N7)-methyltransferase
MIKNEDQARAFCAARVDPSALRKLEKLVELLREENQRQNLVAKASLSKVWRRHVADSLQLLQHVPRGTGEWLDLGSGGGFPGLVIAVAGAERHLTLVESRKLRVEWLRRAAQDLKVQNVTVLQQRLEVVPTRPAEVISARAFAPLSKLLAQSARFSTSNTHWVLPKGRSAGQELEEQSPALRRMFHVEQSLTDVAAGILIGRGVPELR